MLVRKVICCGLFFVAALLVAPAAWAQIVISNYPTRAFPNGTSDNDARPAQFDPGGSINYQDCANDIHLDFTLTVTGSGDHLAVLAGPAGGACIPGSGVTTLPSGCWPVAKNMTLSSTMNVTVRARDVTAYLGSTTLPTTYSAVTSLSTACQSQSCPGPVKLGIYFLVENSDNSVPSAEDAAEFEPVFAGTLGPQAPASVVGAVADGYVTLTWLPPTEPSILGYYVYCVDYGAIGDAALPNVPDSTAGGNTCEDAQEGCVLDAGSLSNQCPTSVFTYVYTKPSCTGATTPTTEAGTTAEAAAPVATEAGSTVVDGEVIPTGPIDTPSGISQINIPGNRQLCTPGGGPCLCASPGNDAIDGSSPSGPTASGATVNLTNLDFYVFAVAAVDSIGNVGPVGNLECGTPGPIRDFWYTYSTVDGGLAGGGYCALEGVGMPAGSACMMAGVGFAALSLLRRRRGPKRG